jgi:hypothetical protein
VKFLQFLTKFVLVDDSVAFQHKIKRSKGRSLAMYDKEDKKYPGHNDSIIKFFVLER